MTDPASPDERPTDPAADTAQFRAFVAGSDEPRAPRVGVPFRVLTLLAGLVVLGVLVWVLFLL